MKNLLLILALFVGNIFSNPTGRWWEEESVGGEGIWQFLVNNGLWPIVVIPLILAFAILILYLILALFEGDWEEIKEAFVNLMIFLTLFGPITLVGIFVA